ncbi:hypothetical protein PUN4_950003 [Paraburkholderia unamae]|nr:hypothetical protein PUN4_950003 [Paraburkholderia unamae]
MMYDSSAHDSVTLGGAGASSAVKLTNVAAGDLSASSTDAVNGSQLYATNENVSNLAGDVTTIGGQITNINGQITSINGQLADAVMYDSSAHDTVTLGGTGASSAVKLTNVAAGDVSASSTDAVNGAQLYATNESVSNLSGDITNLNGQLADAVMYDSSAHDSVTLGGSGATTPVALHNVAAGDVSASSFDAVNGSQLYGLASSTASSLGGGSTVNADGSISNPTYVLNGGTYNNAGDAFTALSGDITNINGQLADAVTYDSSAHESVTLGGAGATTPVALHNVAAGDVSASSTDAVNGSQLYATNENVSNLAGDITNINGQITNINGQLADTVMYDSSAHDTVTLGGTGASSAVKLTNVAAGDVSASSTDAVNGAQLYATNQSISNLSGDITNLNGQLADAVMYDSSAHDSVTLGGAGATTPVALHNVAAGAVNALSTDAVNGSQLYGLASSTASSLGGGSTVNANGSISNPTYVVGGSTFNNVGDAITNLSGGMTQVQGQLADAVSYDSSSHTSVTLGGSGATSAVAIHNVADGTTDGDLINLGQLNAAMADVTNIANHASDPMFAADGDRDTEAATASGTHATAAGANAAATGTQATAVGASSLASGDQSTALGANATAGASNSVALGAGSVADRANTVSMGSAGNERQITNVAAGTQGTDLVNVNQLGDVLNQAQQTAGNTVKQGVADAAQYTNQQIGAFRRDLNAMGAAAMAASSLIPNARAEGRFEMAIAAGTYGGENALAAGANWYVSDRVLLNAHVSRSTGSHGSSGVGVNTTIGF